MREADLERHLTNPTEKDEGRRHRKPAKPAAKPEHRRKAAPRRAKSDKPEPAEIGSKGDYQLNQALNLLKGLQIISKR